MKKATVAIFLAAAVFCFTNPSAALADEQRLEKYVDEKKADMQKVEQQNGKNEILYHRWLMPGLGLVCKLISVKAKTVSS